MSIPDVRSALAPASPGHPLPGEPSLDLHDIQGHILIGFGGAPQVLAAWTVPMDADPAPAARVLADWARRGRITDTTTLLPRKGNRAKRFVAVSGPWVSLAISPSFLSRLAHPATFADTWLTAPRGFHDIPELKDPDNEWVVGPADRPVDLLVVVAAGTHSAAREVISWLEQAAGASLANRFLEDLTPLPGGKEPFGFRDGISQPALFGTTSEGLFDDVRQPLAPDGPAYSRPGQELSWPGEFLFGYPRRSRYNAQRPGPVAEAGDAATSAVARNGSLLVYRRLVQDLDLFAQFVEEKAAELDRIGPDELAARLVGRWHDGAPYATPSAGGDPSAPEIDDFTFRDDAMDARCPLSAHIRKVNPRRGRGSDLDNQVPRLLRRGAPFGGAPGRREPGGHGKGEHGLTFLAYQTSIERQFGDISIQWVNDSAAPNGGGGMDMLIGQTGGHQRFFTVPPEISDGGRTWVTPNGGTMLFAPSITMCRRLDVNLQPSLDAT